MAMKASPEQMLQKYLELKKHPLAKPDKDITRKENHWPVISLMNRYKNPPQILANWIEQHINYTMTKWDLLQKCKAGSTYENPSMNNTKLIE